MSTQDTIQHMVDRIVQRFHPVRVILFGSHARGTARPDSDVDLLVVCDRWITGGASRSRWVAYWPICPSAKTSS